MDPAQYIVRRANLDDLGGLKVLWERCALQVLDLERHLTEFQLVVSMEGDLMGAIALHIEAKQGLLHSEAFTTAEREDDFRPMLWERIQVVARNHGLLRLWTQEQAPFWHQTGFAEADPELLKRLPPGFGDPHRRWWALVLRDEAPNQLSLEKEFELFTQTSRASAEQMMSQARRLKLFAYAVAIIVFLAAMALGVTVFVRGQKDLNRRTPTYQQ